MNEHTKGGEVERLPGGRLSGHAEGPDFALLGVGTQPKPNGSSVVLRGKATCWESGEGGLEAIPKSNPEGLGLSLWKETLGTLFCH